MAKAATRSVTVTAKVSPALGRKLAKYAKLTEHTTSGAIERVLSEHIDYEMWFVGEVRKGLEAAKRGELLTIYGTGFGPADHKRPEGFPLPADPSYLILDPATVSIGDTVVSAENAFAVAGRVGIDAVQFRLGDGAPSGTNATFKVTVNGVDSNTVMLAVQ